MKKKNLIKLLGGLAIAVCCCATVPFIAKADALFNIGKSGQAQEETTLKEYYVVGETFIFPDAPIFSHNGVEYQSTAYLIDPNGKTYQQEAVHLSQSGLYTLEYRAVANDGTLLKEKALIDVYSSLYSINGKGSASHYGTFSDYPNTQSGIALDLIEETEVKFNKKIDISEMKNSYKQDVDFQSFISFYVVPNELYNTDVREINIVLTDAYNSNNQVTIAVKTVAPEEDNADWASLHSYLTAASGNQMQTAIEKHAQGNYIWEDGASYKVLRGTQYGASIQFSMTGGHENYDNLVEKQFISLGWDNEDKRVYAQSFRDGYYYRRFVTDLDDNFLYSEEFEGFTTGEVYLSIKCSGYTADSCRMIITDIAGFDSLSMEKNYFKDELSPSLQIDMQEYEAAPSAKVNESYPIFAATAEDDYDNNVAITADVFWNYGASSASKLALINGRFTPVKEGVYTIEYTAKDDAGNTTVKTVQVLAENEIEDLAIDISAISNTGMIGSEFSANPQISGGTGNYKVVGEAILKSNPNIKYELDSSMCFRPMYSGVYELTYYYSDYIQTKTLVQDITIDSGGAPYISDEITLPRYLITNATYSFPHKFGFIFVDGKPVEKECQVIVSQDNGQYTIVDPDKVKVTASEKFTLIYRLSNAGKISEAKYNLKVVNTGLGVANSLCLEKYFKGDFTATAENKYVLFTASGKNGDKASMEFVSDLLTDNFEFYFATDNNYTGYKDIVITLTDSENPNVKLIFKVFQNAKGEAVVTIAGDSKEYALERSFYTKDNNEFKFKYYNETHTINFTNDVSAIIKKDASGKVFNGFKGLVYLQVALEGIEPARSDNAGIRISRINNQTYSSIKNDISSPEITMHTVREEKTLGDYQELLPVRAIDVLDPNVMLTMKVYDPEMNIVTATDGTVLNGSDPSKSYTILLNKYGNYSVEYYAVDVSGQETSYSYIIKVVDNQAPILTLSNMVIAGKVGNTISLATASATDNRTENVIIEWYVKAPHGKMYSFKQEGVEYDSFIAQETGEYVIYCYAVDEIGNYSMQSYTVVVS